MGAKHKRSSQPPPETPPPSDSEDSVVRVYVRPDFMGQPYEIKLLPGAQTSNMQDFTYIGPISSIKIPSGIRVILTTIVLPLTAKSRQLVYDGPAEIKAVPLTPPYTQITIQKLESPPTESSNLQVIRNENMCLPLFMVIVLLFPLLLYLFFSDSRMLLLFSAQK